VAAALSAVVVAAIVMGSSDPGQRATAPGGNDRPAVGATCAPGREPTAADEWERGDPRPVRAMTVLGCGRLWDGRRFELVARKFRRNGLCLDVYIPDRRAALECAAGVLPHSGAIGVTAYAPPGGGATERLRARALVVGWATAPVARVELTFRSDGVERRRRAALVRVRDEKLLSAAGRKEPFGVFAFVPPERMSAAHLAAFGEDGQQVGRARLPRPLLKAG
jgi:hypothetical protein